MYRLFFFALCLFSVCISCKKADLTQRATANSPAKGQKVKRPHGAPLSAAVTATIGTGGGTIRSADGRLTLSVPAGAVDAATAFSVQAVEPTLNHKAPSYRLLPAGVAFKKEVTVNLSYAGSRLASADERHLFLAFQDADGYYHEASRTQVDAAAKTLAVQTKHFSDWTFFSRIELSVDRPLQNGAVYLKAGEKVVLNLHSYKSSNQKTDAYEADEATLEEDVLDAAVNNAVWSYSPQAGSLSAAAVAPVRTYTAPAKVDRQQSVMITATVNGNLGTDNLGSPVRQMQLLQEVVLLPDDEEYFELNGQRLQNLTANLVPGYMSIGGYEPGGNSLSCYVYGANAGSYACGEMGQPGKCTIEYGIPTTTSGGYICFKPKDCSKDNGLEYSPGGVSITRLAAQIGEYTEGIVSTTLYYYDWCGQGGTKTISGKFKIRKRF